jgi:hypothetical protein
MAILLRFKREKQMSNIQHPISNTQQFARRALAARRGAVGYWILSVGY